MDLYQDLAIRFWLPKAIQEPHGTFFQAVHKLAELSGQYDSDPWMKEFLASLTGSDGAAVQALSAAVRANRNGLYGVAVQQSRTAARTFTEHSNLPGFLRARFESIYASQRFLEGFDCLAQVASLEAPERYRWLEIQLALEKYTCSNFGGEFAAIEQGLETSREKAEAAHYHFLALRSIALQASIKRQQQAGCREVWEEVGQGLDLYWRQGVDRPEALYEFYSILEQCAAQMKLWHAAEALQRHSIRLVELANQDYDPNLILEGSAHAELAAILTAEDRDADADIEQSAAESEWNRVRHEPTSDTYRLFMRIRLAEIQLDRGDTQRALSTLNSSQGLLNSTQYQLLSLNFYRLLGKTCWRLHRLTDAVSAYAHGIAVAENSLRSIRQSAKDRLRWVTKIDDVYRGLTRVWLEQGRTEQAWRLWEWYRARSLPQGSGSVGFEPLTAASWDGIESEITSVNLPSQKHLVYASFEDGSEAWTVDSTGVKAHWIQLDQAHMGRLVNDFAEHCADPSSPLSEIHTEAQALYLILLQPLAADLPGSGLVVAELDRTLSRLVLPALMTPDGKYFAESHIVVYSPGILMEKNLRLPLPLEANDRLLLLDASKTSGAGAVPGHLEERESALQAYSHVRLVTGEEITAAEIKRALSTSTVFAFIGHGEQHGTRTELRLGSNLSLTPADFAPRALSHIKLGILAACSTGAASDDRLLDTDSLVHSFLSGGVPNVIASQWNVDSTATMQLMQSFYGDLGAGETVPRAMYQAQRKILMARDHPYFWAGFNLSGRAN